MRDIANLLRVNHYIKNLMIFAGVLFASSAFTAVAGQLVLLFIIFCLAASCVYVFNDLVDIEQDRLHPQKSTRPLAAGAIPVARGWQLAALLLVSALVLSWFSGPKAVFLIVLYLTINLLYTLHLKHVVLVDTFLVASGYVIRVLAGTWAIGIAPSNWLLLCTLGISLFLGFCKRHNELLTLKNEATSHRLVLGEYTESFLNQIIMITATATLVFYSLYTIAPETVARHGTSNLILTIPFVMYGLFRYIYLIFVRKGGGSPTEEVLADRPLQLNVLAWAATVLVITRYFH